MKSNDMNKVCPVEKAGMLDIGLRRFFQDPQKILKKYIQPGMTVLDLGCGPGYFTIDMARMVGATGRVIAADLQQGMLEIVRKKLEQAGLQHIVDLHTCHTGNIGLDAKVDLILVFYMLHELPEQTAFLQELKSLLKPTGKVLLVEPKLHVSEKAFSSSIEKITHNGFDIVERPKIFFSRAVVIKKHF